MSSGSFKNVIYKLFINLIYSIYMHKQDLTLNNLQGLIFYKTQPIQSLQVDNDKTNQSWI